MFRFVFKFKKHSFNIMSMILYETIIYSIFRILNCICSFVNQAQMKPLFLASLLLCLSIRLKMLKRKRKRKKECSPIFRKARPIHLFLIFQFSSKLYLGLLGNDRQYNEHIRKFVEQI